MLKDTLKDKIKRYLLEKEINKYLKLDRHIAVNFLAQGEYNINFTIEDKKSKYVLRVNTGSQLDLDNQIKYEYDALKTLEISGVTPRVYYLDDSREYFDYGILIMEFLKGRPLEYNRDLIKSANIFSKIHSLDPNKIDNNLIVEEEICSDRIKEGTRLLNNYLKSNLVNKELKNCFINILKWCEENKNIEKYFLKNKWRVINNTEVNSHNFIIGDRENFLIDWEKPVISDPCQDLTQFLAPTTTLWKTDYILSNEEKEDFFKAYERGLARGYNDIRERVHLYTPYLYLRALGWCAYAWLEYQKPDKDIKNMDTFKKIEEYLDVDFMKNLLRDYIK